MASREEIAARHGIPHLADQLVGDTPEELSADAAARAALIQMFTPRDLSEEQPATAPKPEEEAAKPAGGLEEQLGHSRYEQAKAERNAALVCLVHPPEGE